MEEHGKKEKKKVTIELSSDTIWKVLTVALAIVVIYLLIFKDKGSGTAPTQVPTLPSPTAPTQNQPTQAAATGIDITGEPVKGEDNAPVTIVEFSDYQCPFCGRFYTQTLSQLETEYVKTGKAKFVYKDFPLESIHPYALKASEAANCAGDQDKYWEMHNKIFDNQAAITASDLKKYAADLKLETEDFNECLDSGKYTDEVKADIQEGIAAGVRGTPTFYIKGKSGQWQELVGAQPFSALQAVIESELP